MIEGVGRQQDFQIGRFGRIVVDAASVDDEAERHFAYREARRAGVGHDLASIESNGDPLVRVELECRAPVECAAGVAVQDGEARVRAHGATADEEHGREAAVQLRDHVRKERLEAAVNREIDRLRAAAEITILVPH